MNPIAQVPKTWKVEERWHRGSLRACLEAPSDAEADRILEVFILNHLPQTPFDDDRGLLSPFWLKLAIANSWRRTSVWSKGNPLPPRKKIEAAIDSAIEADLIFELPHFPVVGEINQEPSIYFRKSGLLRVLLNKESAHRNQSKANRFHEDAGLSATLIAKFPWRDKANEFRWEGFVVEAIRTLCGSHAKAYFFRRDNDEIDLLLDCLNGERWGIEVTLGNPTRKPRDGFFRVDDRLKLTDRFVVGTEGDHTGRRGGPCLDLVQTVQRIREGLARC